MSDEAKPVAEEEPSVTTAIATATEPPQETSAAPADDSPGALSASDAGPAPETSPQEIPAEPGGEEARPSERIQIGSKKKGPGGPKARPNVSSNIEAAAENQRKKFPPPNIREQLSPELQAELDAALGDGSLDDLIEDSTKADDAIELTAEARVKGKVAGIRNDDIFVELGGRNQGTVPVRHYEDPPEIGVELDLVVARFNADEGLYECTPPNKAMEVANWDDVEEGKILEVTITGSNKGGLECKVAGIRGFMPMGQISLYRVEDTSEFVGQKLACVVTEANREKRNLVVSHKAVMERERKEAREKLLQEIEPGQIREGIVRNLRDFGAFVDLGGVDGLIHISQLSWDHVKHPSEVLEEGQQVKVRVEKVDSDTGKIGLAYRDLAANPWDKVDGNYPVGTTVKGTVSKIMDFGAFVKLEPGVEGLIHISELAHGRVWRASDAVTEGEEVTVKVLSVDTEKQRIGLSLKALMAAPQKATDDKEDEPEFALPPDAPKAPKKKQGNLKGGKSGASGGEKFGLKW